MSIDPYAVRTVKTPNVMPPKPLSDTYRDKTIERLGRAPTMADLATLENAALRRVMGTEPQRCVGKEPQRRVIGDATRAAMSAAKKAEGEATVKRILSLMRGPMTLAEVAAGTGITQSGVRAALDRAWTCGMVTKRMHKGKILWEVANANP
ncbi:MAG: hypothetical protein QM523_00970 [Candidatus Pacebacteria bacterium]|nr:hypothetical protein [Candidatus Paceibacterota bacterium]